MDSIISTYEVTQEPTCESLKIHQITGKNAKVFMSKFLQVSIDLGKNVPRDTPFTLNEQLTTSLAEQFWVKFMAFTTATNWVM